MTVRAKMKVERIESTQSRVKIDPKGDWAEKNLQTVEIRTVVLSPVGCNSPENEKFWAATPTGEIKLGMLNPEAWEPFQLGKEFYVDFNEA